MKWKDRNGKEIIPGDIIYNDQGWVILVVDKLEADIPKRRRVEYDEYDVLCMYHPTNLLGEFVQLKFVEENNEKEVVGYTKAVNINDISNLRKNLRKTLNEVI